MRDTLEGDAINQALEIIDRSLGKLHQRELVSTSEVSDLLLDMRSVLAAAELELELDRTPAAANQQLGPAVPSGAGQRHHPAGNQP